MNDAHGDLDREEKRNIAYVHFLESLIDYIEKPIKENWKRVEIKILDAIESVSKEEYFEFEFHKSIEIFDRMKKKSELIRNVNFHELKKFICVISPHKKFSRKITDFIEKMTPEE